MAKRNEKVRVAKNSHQRRRHVSKLGRELQKLHDEYVASGGKLLNRKELERELAERRGLR